MSSRKRFVDGSRIVVVVLVFGLSFGAAVLAQSASSPQPVQSPSGLGRSPTSAEVKAWDISIHPDGRELPPGRGTATQGAMIYTHRRCAECHGPTGKEGPAYNLVAEMATHGTGASYTVRYWPFATKVWDYIYRAMPYDQVGRLTPDEAYALTALLLYWNGIIQETDVMDAVSLPKVQMPHRARYTVPPPRQADMPRGFTLPSQAP